MSDRLPHDRADAVRGREAAVDQRRAKTSRAPKTPTPVLVIFLLSKQGHRRWFTEDHAKADEQFRRSLLYAEGVKMEVRNRDRKARVEVHTFGSFTELIRQRPSVRGTRWSGVILVTHGTAAAESETLAHSGLWLGNGSYFAASSDLDANIYAAIERANPKTLDAFRQSFRPEAETMIVACGVGQTPVEPGEFMRDLFGTDGFVAVPNVLVGLDKRTGEVGAMESDDDPEIRRLTRDDWAQIPAR